jgi:type I restriction enzyme S subunit
MSGAAVAKPDRGQKPLPQGWRWVRLADVIREAQPGFASGLREPNGVLQLRMNNVGTRGNLVWDEVLRVPLEGRSLADCTLAPGDVVFNNTNSTELVGKSALFEGCAEAVVYSNHFTRLRVVVEALDPGYLANWLLSQWQAGVFRGLCNRWIGQSAVKNDRLLSLEIPLPSLAEQRRIAATLREQIATVEKARAAAEAQLEAAKAMPGAYLREVFRSPEAQRWPKKRLRDVGEIVSGITLGRKLRTAETRLVPYLRVANVKDGRLDLSDVYQIAATEDETAKLQLKYGDLLLTEGGDPDKLGRGTFWEDQLPLCLHQNHIFRVRLDVMEFSPDFLSAQMSSAYGKAYFLAHAKQTTGIATINQKVLGNFPLMVPPRSEQEAVARHLASKMEKLESLCRVFEERLTALGRLAQSLLRQAFRGEL